VTRWLEGREVGLRPELAAAAPWRRRVARLRQSGGAACRGEAGAALKAARGQGSRHGQRGYGVGQSGRGVRRRAGPYHGGAAFQVRAGYLLGVRASRERAVASGRRGAAHGSRHGEGERGAALEARRRSARERTARDVALGAASAG
jgi:hypothetical protein